MKLIQKMSEGVQVTALLGWDYYTHQNVMDKSLGKTVHIFSLFFMGPVRCRVQWEWLR